MADTSSCRRGSRPYGWLLLGLLLLFLFRVVAQLVQAFSPVTALPSFEIWQSGAIPYPLLVVFQIIILIACARVVWSFLSGTVVPSGKKGRLLLIFGWIYFIAMGLRLLIGLTMAPDHYWFGAIVPALFHLVLAGFVVVCGFFHSARGGESVAVPPGDPA
ncbi:MAG: hypothetical protein GDA65_19400 [Nitrospira sp. CR1.1]|nr:hypothetical protein [Nitrospira sp. CR1.1]